MSHFFVAIVNKALEDLLENVVDRFTVRGHSCPVLIVNALGLELPISFGNLPLELDFLIAFLPIVCTTRDGFGIGVDKEGEVGLN